MKHTVRLMALALLLLLGLLCCGCQQDSNAASDEAAIPEAPAAIIGHSEAASFTTESGWKAAQRIILNRCSIGVSRSDSFTFPPMQDAVMASFIHPTDPILMTISEKALDLEMTALYDTAIKQGGNLLELIYGFNENYMAPGTVRQKTMQVAGGTAFLMAAQSSPLAGNSDISCMGLFFTDGVLLYVGCMDNSATPDELIADLTGMMESLVVTQ